MKKGKKEGIWIPVELMNDNQLDWKNKVLLTEIYFLMKLKDGCFASNQHFGKLLGINNSAASKRISRLEELGYITCTNIFHPTKTKLCIGRKITKGSSPKNDTVVPKKQRGSSRKPQEVVPTEQEGSSIGKPINTYTNTSIKEQLLIHNTGATENANTNISDVKQKFRDNYDASYQLLLNATELGSEIFYYINKDKLAPLKKEIGEEKYAELLPVIRMYNISRGNL